MIVGFTGTQKGMTADQKKTFRYFITHWEIDEFHHGDCIGADADAHKIVRKISTAPVHLHPPVKRVKRAFCEADKTYPSDEYLTRNRHIVKCSDLLIAAPDGFEEKRKSGTWYTVRQAEKCGVPVLIIWPDGTYED